MSYLVDALRKAERERNLGKVPDLGYATHDREPANPSRLPGWLIVVIAALVGVNLLVLAAFWWAGQGGEQEAGVNTQTSVESPAEASGQVTREQAPAAPAEQPRSSAEPASEKRAEVPKPQQAEPAPVQQPIVDQESQPSKSAAQPWASSPSPEPPEFSDPPQQDIPHFNALAQSEQSKLPSLKVNGHLYSSIPGRSFVLINGRRYHEGQRLPEGPAIVLIDQEGAIFNYLDTRFRLDAPR